LRSSFSASVAVRSASPASSPVIRRTAVWASSRVCAARSRSFAPIARAFVPAQRL
jgi:hypothetical protein